MLALTVPRKSWLHAMPVGYKLAAMCAASLYLFTVKSWSVAALAVCLVAILFLSVDLTFARIGLKRLKPLVFLLAVIFIYHVIISLWQEGVVICLRLLAAVALATLVTMTSRLDDMMALIEKLAKPFQLLGLPARAVGLGMAMVIRFTPVFLAKGNALSEAWRARSKKRPGASLLVPLTLGVLDDADRVAEALSARGGLSTGQSTNNAASRPHMDSHSTSQKS